MPSPSTIALVWGGSIALAVVVTAVVAVLLHAVLVTARQIHGVAADIWTHGQRVANNTVHLLLLDRTNQLFGAMLTEAATLARATARIAEATGRGGGAR